MPSYEDEYINKLTLDTSGSVDGVQKMRRRARQAPRGHLRSRRGVRRQRERDPGGRGQGSGGSHRGDKGGPVLQPGDGGDAGQRGRRAGRAEGVAESMNRLRGEGSPGGSSGQGILGVSYAFQDFTSVISTGGGFGRALASIQNNIPPILAGLGVGAGLAGAISLVTVGAGLAVPALTSFFGAMDAEAAKKTAEETEEAGRRDGAAGRAQVDGRRRGRREFPQVPDGPRGRRQGDRDGYSPVLPRTGDPETRGI